MDEDARRKLRDARWWWNLPIDEFKAIVLRSGGCIQVTGAHFTPDFSAHEKWCGVWLLQCRVCEQYYHTVRCLTCLDSGIDRFRSSYGGPGVSPDPWPCDDCRDDYDEIPGSSLTW